MNISVNQNCVHCGLCLEICPSGLFDFPESGEGMEAPAVRRPEACIRCGHCVCACPADAIVHSEFGPDRKIPIAQRSPSAYDDLLAMGRARRSVRRFQKERVPRETVEKIIRFAELAPTACNSRQVFWTEVSDPEILRGVWRETAGTLKKAVDLLASPIGFLAATLFPNSEAGRNYRRLPFVKAVAEKTLKKDLILHDAPTILIAHYAVKDGMFAEMDAHLALQNAVMAAEALGLGAFYLGFVQSAATRNSKIAKLLQIPRGRRIAGGLALGFPDIQYRFSPVREYPEPVFLD